MANNQIRLNKKYTLEIQKQDKNGKRLDEKYVITNPITVKISVVRNIYSGVSDMNIDIYNLATETRNMIFKDWFFDIKKEDILFISLSAGYDGKNQSCLFLGDIWNAYITRVGTDIITRIQAKCGLRNMTQEVNHVFYKGQTHQDIIDYCISQLDGIKAGKMSKNEQKLEEETPISGKPLEIIKAYSPGRNVYIDAGVVNILAPNEGFISYVPLINDKSGLLNTPSRKPATVTIQTMFMPELVVGQIIEVNSKLEPQFNGQYRIFGIRHEGIISDAIESTMKTTIEMNVGSELYGNFKPL